ncbi:MAG TPA: DinB family protein [Candidatus Limnocylindrales bacterium]|nr:DinB family protein [Candidatus Limnocylindrales bacterium]
MDDTLRDEIDLLRRTPDVIRALLGGLPDSWTGTPDVADGWRPRDVVGHLISAELDDWMPRVRRILEHGDQVPFDPFDRFAHVERDRDATLDELIERFAALRAASLADLEGTVTEADLDRPGRHAALGPVTLRQLIATWAVHDLDHLSQAFAGLAGSRDAAVGPWKAYLGILLRRDDPSAVPG